MAHGSMGAFVNKEFIASSRWKCEKSPSGAHHWIINSQQMTCKFCHFCKPVSTENLGYQKPEAK